MPSNKFVSIVDDEFDIIALFHDALQSIPGISIFRFTDPKIALEHFKANQTHYGVVISDLRMPNLNGIQLIENMKELNPLVRTVLMTAFAIEDDRFVEYAKKKIINGFLQKPIRLDDLRSEVNDQLHAYELLKLKPM